VVADGIEITMSSRTGAEMIAGGQSTFARRMRDLVDEGRIRRNKRHNSEHADSYILLVPGSALLTHNGGEERKREEKHLNIEGVHRGESEPRSPLPKVPELREPYVLAVREKDERGRLREVYEYVARLGKRRGEVVRFLLENGGSSTIPELMERFAGPKTRPRDFKRRQLSDLLGYRRQHKGTALSVGPPIIEIEGDAVCLVADWIEALEKHRELGGEQDAAIRQKATHLRQRAAYRDRYKNPADPAPSKEEMEERRKRRQRDRQAAINDALMRLFAEDPAHRELYPDRMAEAVSRLLPEDFPRNAAPYGKPKPEEVVAFLENHELPVPTPIYDRYDPPAERRFREMERSAREASSGHSPLRESEPVSMPESGSDGVIRHGPECACEWCGDPPAPVYARIAGRGVSER
jgi:hypothetical protein